MRFLRSSLVFLVTGIIIYLPVSVTAGSSDNQLWSSVVLQKEIDTGAKLEFEQQLRLRNQTPLINQTFSEFRFSCPASGNLEVTLHYRQIFYQDKTSYRIAASTQASSLPGVKWLNVRVKLQRQQSPGSKPIYCARFRTTVNIPDPQQTIVLFLQAEPWLLLDDQQSSWTRYRLDAGIKCPLLKRRLSASVYYRFQGDHHASDWSGINILGLSLKTVL